MRKQLLLLALLLFLVPRYSFAQIEYIDVPPLTPGEMAQKIMGEGVEILNPQMLCGDRGSGYFWNGDAYDFGIESGIVLTTGTNREKIVWY